MKLRLGKLFSFNSELSKFRLLQTIEVWWRSGDWRHPCTWIWCIDRNCGNGCIIIEFGWWGVTKLGEDCKSYY